jgi:large subunit ribosomal protein L25
MAGKPKADAHALQLTVQRRVPFGTRPVRRLRAGGVVPGVVYGRGMEPLSIVVNRRELVRLLHSKSGEHALVRLKLDGAASWEKPVLVQAVQHHPVDGHVLHVDFHAVALTDRLKIKVPVVLRGEPVGVKQEGGILEHFLREIEIECLPTEIPSGVEFDVSALTIGQTVHVRDLTPPPNTKITTDPDGAIASVQKPKEEKPEEAAAEVTEPEVLREKKEEEAPAGEAKGEAAEPQKDTKSSS